MAVDTNYIPYGSILWLNTKPLPYDDDGIQSLFVAADTGADIKGVTRGDIYFGTGSDADFKAHRTKVQGEYYFLIPNSSITIHEISQSEN
jgi:membrane-bound lytic murein transglycosylase